MNIRRSATLALGLTVVLLRWAMTGPATAPSKLIDASDSRPSRAASAAVAFVRAGPVSNPVVTPTVAKAESAARVLDLDANGDDRVQALYALTQAGPGAFSELRIILVAPIPRDLSRREFEISLRVTAIEALDALWSEDLPVTEVFVQLLAHEDTTLRSLAAIGLRGFEDGRPGKIKRFVDEMVN